ncbi:MAG TPA: hypothetical protein DCM28_05835 [Phycisphaerales bacterium]|nr:hypothetical protein [Phycisphaerales bacterium]|tara:strand:- start:121 stop:528 length:408 start_codon:yes stop_codon:yes gene_type:complete
MNKRRFNVLHVSDQAKEFVDEMSQWSGIDRKTIADRVFSWLGHQPRELQAAILMSFPQAFQQDFAELMLKRLSEQEAQANWPSEDQQEPVKKTVSKESKSPSNPAAPKRFAAKDNRRYSPGTKPPPKNKPANPDE